MSNWYLQNGKDSDVVVSSRVRLVRNLNGFKFLNKCSKEEQEKILDTDKRNCTKFRIWIKIYCI